MKFICLVIYLFLLKNFSAFSIEQLDGLTTQNSNKEFSHFLKEIDTNHPEIRLDELSLNAARSQKSQKGFLSDPMLSISRDNMPLYIENKKKSSSEMNSPNAERIGWGLSLTQQFPWFGTLKAEEKNAESEESAKLIDVDVQKFSRRIAAANLFIEIVTLRKLKELQLENKLEAEKLMRYAELNFSSGMSSHGDILQFQNDLELLKQDILFFEAREANLKDEILFFTNKMFEFSNFPTVEEIDEIFPLLSDLYIRKNLSTQELITSKIQLNQKKFLPKITTTWQMMRQDDGMVSGSAMIGIDLPIFSNSIRNYLNTEEISMKELQTQQREIYEKFKKFKLAQIDRQLSLYEGVISTLSKVVLPNAQEHLKAKEVEYAKGKLSILKLVEEKRALIKYRMEYIKNKSAYTLLLLQKAQFNRGYLEKNSSVFNLSTFMSKEENSQDFTNGNKEGM